LRIGYLLVLSFIFSANPVCASDVSESPPDSGPLRQAYAAMTSYQESRAFPVSHLTLTRDAAAFELKSGKIFLMEPVLGRLHTAVFIGDGVFRFTPPTAIEKGQLKKFAGCEKLEEPIDSAVFRFTDGTGEELLKAVDAAVAKEKEGADGMRKCKESRKKLLEHYYRNIESRILLDIHSGSTGYFSADISTKSKGDLLLEIDPQAREEVELRQFKDKFGGIVDTWNSFHLAGEYEGSEWVLGQPAELVRIPHFEADLTIEENGHMKGTAVVDVVPVQESVKALALDFSQLAETDEVTDDKGRPCFFVHDTARDKLGEPAIRQDSLDVYLPEPIAPGETRKLTVRYHSDKLIRKMMQSKEYIVTDSKGWYPSVGYLNRATSTVTYRFPPDLQVMAVGQKVKEWKEGGKSCATWEEKTPVALTCFTLGDFKYKKLAVEGLPPADIYFGKEHYGLRIGGDPVQNVAADLLNSLNYFQKLYGPYPFPGIIAAEIPATYGRGLPGFLHLAWSTFQDDSSVSGIDESFRAHEVSHQWWGHLVGWGTYHDQWLSEGFAEYSGAMFAHAACKDKKKDMMVRIVENWRNDILGKGNLAFQRYGFPRLNPEWTMGSRSGPIWLGTRLSSSRSPVDYQILVYEKGAYVLHMIRMMMRDLNSGSDDRFFAMMKDFAATYAWKDATTEDFRKVVEKNMNTDLGWFFDQWVYGTDIPRYHFTWSAEPGENGKSVLVCTVEQSDVPATFKMPVPIVIEFGKDRYAITRILVDEPTKTFRINLPEKPRDVKFNFYQAVLCSEK
jgi:hypothetical protein